MKTKKMKKKFLKADVHLYFFMNWKIIFSFTFNDIWSISAFGTFLRSSIILSIFGALKSYITISFFTGTMKTFANLFRTLKYGISW